MKRHVPQVIDPAYDYSLRMEQSLNYFLKPAYQVYD